MLKFLNTLFGVAEEPIVQSPRIIGYSPVTAIDHQLSIEYKIFNEIDGTKQENYNLVDASILRIKSLERMRASYTHPTSQCQ